MILKDVISHVRDRNYLREIDRDYVRVKATGEVFTPLGVITKKLNDLESYDPIIFKDATKTFLEPSCGDGNFLGEVLIRKLESLSKEEITDEEFEQALSTIYGLDIMIDNVDLCRERLLCGREDLRHIVEQNIVCADGLNEKNYKFKPMTDARRKKEAAARKSNLKEKIKRQKAEEELRKLKEREKELKKALGSSQFGIKLPPKVKKSKTTPIDISCL